MSQDNLNPATEPTMTENDLRTWYHRMATTLVSAAAQSNEIKRQSDAIGELNTRLDRMDQENDKLRSDVTEAMEFVRQAEADRDRFKANLEEANEANQRLVDSVRARNEQIDGLRLELTTEKDQHSVTKGERDQAIANYNREKGDKEYWRDRAGMSETKLAEARSEVDELKKALANALKDRDEAMATVVKVKAAVGAFVSDGPVNEVVNPGPEQEPAPETAPYTSVWR